MVDQPPKRVRYKRWGRSAPRIPGAQSRDPQPSSVSAERLVFEKPATAVLSALTHCQNTLLAFVAGNREKVPYWKTRRYFCRRQSDPNLFFPLLRCRRSSSYPKQPKQATLKRVESGCSAAFVHWETGRHGPHGRQRVKVGKPGLNLSRSTGSVLSEVQICGLKQSIPRSKRLPLLNNSPAGSGDGARKPWSVPRKGR